MESRRQPDRPAVGLARVVSLALAGLAGSAGAAFFLLPLLGRLFVRFIGIGVTACVWLATSIGVGVSVWDVLATVGRVLVKALLTPTGSVALSILAVLGIMALYWLQRLLESEEGSSS
jgi:hypothetical protein